MALELTQEQKDAGWQVKNLGDITSKIGSGATPRGGKNVYLETGAALIRSQNVHDHKLNLDDVARIDENAEQQLKSVLVQNYDVLLNITGDSIARCAYVPQDIEIAYVNQHVSIIRTNPSEVNYKYLQKYLVSPKVKKQLLDMSDGGTRKALTKGALEGFEIVIPPIGEQKRIAEILGSVDDKIEANSRLIQNLEELADLTFDSHLEDLSEVLEDTTYGSLNFFGGGTPNTKTPDYWDGEVNWVTPTDVTSLKSHTLFESSRKITEAGLAACSSKLHPAGSIMMTSRATIGRFAVNQVPAATNQGFIVVQPANEYERWWIYHSMKKDVELFLLLANGATFLELSRRVFKDIPLKMFHGKTELPAIHNQIIALEAENKSLGETRNLLIRHLIG